MRPDGGWDNQRDAVARQFIDLIARFAPDFEECLESYECSARRTLRSGSASPAGTPFRARFARTRCGSTGSPRRTPVPGMYLCGAATHRGGSVIATNGKNAADVVLADLRARTGEHLN